MSAAEAIVSSSAAGTVGAGAAPVSVLLPPPVGLAAPLAASGFVVLAAVVAAVATEAVPMVQVAAMAAFAAAASAAPAAGAHPPEAAIGNMVAACAAWSGVSASGLSVSAATGDPAGAGGMAKALPSQLPSVGAGAPAHTAAGPAGAEADPAAPGMLPPASARVQLWEPGAAGPATTAWGCCWAVLPRARARCAIGSSSSLSLLPPPPPSPPSPPLPSSMLAHTPPSSCTPPAACCSCCPRASRAAAAAAAPAAALPAASMPLAQSRGLAAGCSSHWPKGLSAQAAPPTCACCGTCGSARSAPGAAPPRGTG